jgi:poly-gamma-glutamate capsule biosynthesis protein CapA/YwtB (metallophosphatase superfamily)
MNAHPPQRPAPRGLFGRPILTVTIVLAALAGMGVGGVALANRDSGSGATWQQPPNAIQAAPQASTRAPEPESTVQTAGGATITLSATGDVIMGSAPNRLPANDGNGFFDSVAADLKSDLVMGNLEQPITNDTGTSKCGSPARDNCFAFRSPPSYAQHLKEAGFELMNTANNHSKDFGAAGFQNTIDALNGVGIKHTGVEDEITTVTVNGIKVAVLGFSPYAGANNLNDLDHTRTIIQKAKQDADLVVVQAHMGAEGSDKQHVKPGSEIYFGENRGDPITFTHAAIDAGADVVIGHGPHVLRGMEFYQGHLIVYSLGNFAGGGKTLSSTGVLKYAGIVHVTLTKDGAFAGGDFRSTYLSTTGVPTRDKANEKGRSLVRDLSKEDFGSTAAQIDADGKISAP